MSQFWNKLLELAGRLDQTSYYELLGVQPSAAPDELLERYHALVGKLHPDRHARQRDPARVRALTQVFARIAEAYRVLSTPKLRSAYDAQLAKGGAAGRADDEPAPSGPDPKSPLARDLFGKARAAAARGDRRGALQQLQLAK